MKAKFYLLLSACTFFVTTCVAYTDTVKPGSFIINMGVTPQTIANGLKPYGLVYQLMKDHKVPVWWIINPNKTKDGTDFIHNGVTYRGGTFVIPAAYRTSAVNTTISNWQAQGVVGASATSNIITNVYMVLKFTPRWTLDTLNGELITNFFINAGIPASAHGGSLSTGWKSPAQLDACDDIFVMPHADPTWATHGNLWSWNQTHKGNIWAGCHSPSAMENIVSPDGTKRMNFLTTDGMVPHKQHTRNSTPPFTYAANSEPFMQFIGRLDGAVTNGSEQAYLPKLSSQWRSTTTIGAYDPDHPDIPSKSNGAAAVLAFGRAFGDTSRGFVMYEASHDVTTDGTEAEQVAAQRAFFNYSFFIMTKTLDFDIAIQGAPQLSVVNQSYPLSFSVSSAINLANYTIKWSSNAGTFNVDNQQNVHFTPTGAPGQNINISVTLTDACGREYVTTVSTFATGVLANKTVILSAINRSGNGELSWAADSRQVSHCEIQKQENNIYKPLGTVFTEEAPGNKTYKFTDKAVQGAIAYYRLKVVSRSGDVSYSNIARLVMDDRQVSAVLLGNPVVNTIRVGYHSPSKEILQVRLIDMQGRIVLAQQVTVQNNLLQVNLAPRIGKGQYVLQLASSAGSQALKVLVE
jgi:hypothetical protein